MARLMPLLLVVAPMILITFAGTGQMGYRFKMTNGGKKFNETIYVDVRKGLEMYKLQQASSGEDTGDIMYDFKKNLTMIRLPKARSCFLRTSTGNVSRPAALQQAIKLARKSPRKKLTTKSVENFKAVSKIKDRSNLSKEMADQCAGLPIYRITKGDLNQNDVDQMDDPVHNSDVAQVLAARRDVRSTACRVEKHKFCVDVLRKKCLWFICKTSYERKCTTIERRVCNSVLASARKAKAKQRTNGGGGGGGGGGGYTHAEERE